MSIHSNKLTERTKLEIIEKYKTNKFTYAQLAREYGVARSCMRAFLLCRKIPKNPIKITKYTFDEHYFDSIDTEGKAYFLGFLFADGCNDVPTNRIMISLAVQDTDILKKFKEELKSDRPLKISNRKEQNPKWQDVCVMVEHSQIMSKRLTELGCMQRKTFLLEFPKLEHLPEHLIHHFIRGYFDGDGCLGFYDYIDGVKAKFSFASTVMFCEKVKEIIQNKLNIYSKVAIIRGKEEKTIRNLNVSGRQQVIRVMDWLYQDATFYLERKHEIYLKMKNHVKRRPGERPMHYSEFMYQI